MKIVKNIISLRKELQKRKENQEIIGFVPTMGALHEGHLALVREAISQTDCVVVSIFVNPKQFGENEDFDNYPRNLEKDIEILSTENVDYLFAPDCQEMWPEGNETFVDTQNLSNILQGELRPGHFRGVLSVVAKLFNITQANKAFFGEKDFQQLAIIRKMVKDLSFPIDIIGVPTLRESNGVAASSRNALLTKEEKKAAVIILKALNQALETFNRGETNSEKLKSLTKNIIKNEPRAFLEQIEILDFENLKPISEVKDKAVILLVVKFGNVRLLDHIYLN